MGTNDMPYRIKVIRSRKRRKSMSIQVREQTVVVRVPFFTPEPVIEELLKSREEWIRRALHQQRESDHTPWHDRTFRLLGDPLVIVWQQPPQPRWSATLYGNELRISGPSDPKHNLSAKALVVRWFRSIAQQVIAERVSLWANQLHLPIGNVRVKEQKTRWGSCSAQGNLNFNWRLVQAPVWVVDYVIVHELCHLRELNHSKRFWRLVEAAYPNYKDAIEWLRSHGSELYFDIGERV